MELIERIERFIEYKQLSVSGFEKSISASNGVIRHAILKKTDIYSRFLVKILDNYPELSADWLLREEGEILREPDREKPSDTTVSILRFKSGAVATFVSTTCAYPGVSTDDIKRANGLKSDAIRAGQKLTIPIP